MRTASDKRKTKKKKRLIIVISAAFCAFIVLIALLIINAYVFPFKYLSVLVSNPNVEKRANGELVVHFIDVGQGDATIIEFPDGKTMLIDSGGEDCTYLLRYIRALKIKTFDYLMLTHPDTDHCGGLDDVLSLYGANEIFMPYCPNEKINDAYFRFTSKVKQAAKNGTKVKISQTFSAIYPEDNENFYYAMILSPLSHEFEGSFYQKLDDDKVTDGEVNDISAVLYLEYAGTRFLFTGDISENVENDICYRYDVLGSEAYSLPVYVNGKKRTLVPNLQNIDVLKVSHHGSSSSTTQKFVELTAPDVALIGVGIDNLYGHPSPSVIGRLISCNPDCKIYRTDEQGSIVIRVNENGEKSYQTAKQIKTILYNKKTFSEFIYDDKINDERRIAR